MPETEALHYQKLSADQVVCSLCPQQCRLQEGKTGLCRVRTNRSGRLRTLNYGEISSLALDPVEKKPLYHFYPGAFILSAGSYGCNLACSFCQNYAIAQHTPPTRYVPPRTMAELALQYRNEDNIGVAFTYNEPSVWYEYIMAAAPLIKQAGLKTVLVSNGYLAGEPLRQLLPYIDALNIDVKAFNEEFYRKMCHGRLQPVKETVESLIGKTHVEITTLIIPGLNDNPDEIEELSRWLASLDPRTVLHLSRYHPAYRLDLPPTPIDTIKKAQQIARQHLHFVFSGNLPDEENTTCCLQCGHELIKRYGYQVDTGGIRQGRCSACQSPIDYIALWQSVKKSEYQDQAENED